jgi:hypothetical protein
MAASHQSRFRVALEWPQKKRIGRKKAQNAQKKNREKEDLIRSTRSTE